MERGRHLSRQQQQQQQHFQRISQSVCTSVGERRVQQPGADARSSLPEVQDNMVDTDIYVPYISGGHYKKEHHSLILRSRETHRNS